jgi:predicted HicB family RNase H-like nuclease
MQSYSKVAVAFDPKVRRKAEAAAKRAGLSLSSWIVRLATRELHMDWEPPPRGRPPKPKKGS